MTFENDPLIQQWYIKIDAREGTQRSYQVAMNKYCEWTGHSPTELIDEAEEDEDNGIRMRKRKINTNLLGFKNILKDRGMAPSTINLYMAAVRSFYDSFDIVLPKIKNEKGDISLEQNQGKLLSKEEILKLANAANPRERALIYLMAHSGMAQNEARQLTLEKFYDAASLSLGKKVDSYEKLIEYEKELENEVLTLHIIREKVNYRHITFIPPESTREIINYLKERVHGRNEKIRIIDNEGPIFVNNYGKELSKDSIVTNFRRIGEQIGFHKKKQAYSYWRAHALRKYFISTIINEFGDKVFADFLSGHKIDNTTRAYWIADEEKLKKRYLKVLPHLSLDKVKVKDIETKEYQKLNNKMNDEITKLKKENETIKRDFALLIKDKQFVNDLMELIDREN